MTLVVSAWDLLAFISIFVELFFTHFLGPVDQFSYLPVPDLHDAVSQAVLDLLLRGPVFGRPVGAPFFCG